MFEYEKNILNIRKETDSGMLAVIFVVMLTGFTAGFIAAGITADIAADIIADNAPGTAAGITDTTGGVLCQTEQEKRKL